MATPTAFPQVATPADADILADEIGEVIDSCGSIGFDGGLFTDSKSEGFYIWLRSVELDDWVMFGPEVFQDLAEAVDNASV